jgi:hypothetical protein
MSKTNTKINRFIKWIVLRIVQTLIVVLGYLLYTVIQISQFALYLVAYIGRYVGITIHGFEEVQETDYTQKFSKDEIDELSETVKAGETIQEIQDRLSVSYRQARKIKQAAKDSPVIRHYSWADKVA